MLVEYFYKDPTSRLGIKSIQCFSTLHLELFEKSVLIYFFVKLGHFLLWCRLNWRYVDGFYVINQSS